MRENKAPNAGGDSAIVDFKVGEGTRADQRGGGSRKETGCKTGGKERTAYQYLVRGNSGLDTSTKGKKRGKGSARPRKKRKGCSDKVEGAAGGIGGRCAAAGMWARNWWKEKRGGKRLRKGTDGREERTVGGEGGHAPLEEKGFFPEKEKQRVLGERRRRIGEKKGGGSARGRKLKVPARKRRGQRKNTFDE